MKAISIRQPYAWAICAGHKDVENRIWATRYNGPVLIHAGAREIKDDIDGVMRLVAEGTGETVEKIERDYRRDADFGAVVGVAHLVACVQRFDSPWFNGPYGFVLRDARRVGPVPFKGQLGFFDVPHAILNLLEIAR